ncbi:MAG: hypothetical protein AAGD32_04240 [Planctomycetota bacterium]
MPLKETHSMRNLKSNTLFAAALAATLGLTASTFAQDATLTPD